MALLALHARLFLPPEALSSFDAMPALPVAQTLTRVAQALGVLALWRLTATRWARASAPGDHLELGFARVLSLSLVGHAWQSYVTWLIVAFVPLADPRVWGAVPRPVGDVLGALAVAGYASIAIHDVALYRVIGNTSPAATRLRLPAQRPCCRCWPSSWWPCAGPGGHAREGRRPGGCGMRRV